MSRLLVRYAPLLVVAAAWELVVQGGLVSRLALPPLQSVLGAWGDLIGSGELAHNAVASVYRAALGLVLAIAVGGALGLAMATSRAARIVANPLVQIFYPMPKSALIPLMLIWFGFGDLSKIVLIFLGCLLPVIVSTYNGARGVDDQRRPESFEVLEEPRPRVGDQVGPRRNGARHHLVEKAPPQDAAAGDEPRRGDARARIVHAVPVELHQVRRERRGRERRAVVVRVERAAVVGDVGGRNRRVRGPVVAEAAG